MKSHIAFATAGVPRQSPKTDTGTGLETVSKLGLDGMELEFVHGVRMKEDTAALVRAKAQELKLSLSVHGPYYINLNSLDAATQVASQTRIFESARVGALCGAGAVTFHPAYIMKTPREQVAATVQTALETILADLDERHIDIALKPETTGKETQFGSIDELLALYRQNNRIKPYVDFSHLHARANGRFKTKKDFQTVLTQIEQTDSKLLDGLHMHVSGIAYGPKGEKNHLVLQDPTNDFNYKWLLETLHEFGVRGRIVCESPNIEEDALLMKNYFKSL